MTPEMDRAWRNQAFVSALEELFRRHPLPTYKYPKTTWRRGYDRKTALYNARTGCPIYMIDIFAHKVPSQEIRAIHALIYG